MAKNKSISSIHFPYIPVKITVVENNYNLEALVDTGFNGQVILPPNMFTNGQLPPKFVTCKLADNSIVEMPIHRGTLKLGDKKLNEIMILIIGDEPIIGREVIKHFKVTLDHGRKIILEK